MRTALCALALAAVAFAAPCHVTGTLRNAAQTPASGFVVLTWLTFTGADNVVHPAGAAQIQIAAGRFDALLEPGQYSIGWGSIGKTDTATLVVPATSTATLASCLRTTSPPPILQLALSQLSPSGATTGQAVVFDGAQWAPANVAAGAIPISGVTGLQAALDAKATATALTSEATTRAAADTTNAAAIASEATTRAGADSSEASARAAAVSAEASSRTSADTAEADTRSAAITSEATTRGAADTANAAATAAHSARTDNPHVVTRAQVAAAPAPYRTAFSGQTQLTIAAGTHGLASAAIAVTCYDTAGPPGQVEPDHVTVDPSTFEVNVYFAVAQDGACVLR
jgi:hypothetical protein